MIALCFDGWMHPTRYRVHLCLESGAMERPVSLTKHFPTTGGVCVIVLPPCGIRCGAHVPLLHR